MLCVVSVLLSSSFWLRKWWVNMFVVSACWRMSFVSWSLNFRIVSMKIGIDSSVLLFRLLKFIIEM